MAKPLSITILRRYFLLIGIVPVLLIATFEILSVSESENEIQNLVNSQIDNILFSINESSWEIVNSWFDDRNRPLGKAKLSPDNSYPESVIKSQLIELEENPKTLSKNLTSNTLASQIRSFDWSETLKLWDSGYRKIELFVSDSASNQMHLAGIVENNDKKQVLAFTVDKKKFIENEIYPVLELAANSGFTLEIINNFENDNVVVSTGKQKIGTSYTKALWLIPGYQLRLTSQFHSVEDSLRTRRLRSLILLSLIFLFLTVSLYFIFTSVKKQIELSELKSDFVANVSHELRTPLSLIRMFAESLEMGRVRTEEKKIEYFRTIRSETERLTHLINNILNFSKMESGTKRYSFSPVDVNEIIEEIMSTYKYKLEQEGFSHELTISTSPCFVNGDKEALREAFLNILDNAMKYSSENKFVAVETRIENEKVLVRIQDRGIGISSDDQRKIFDKFYRVSGTLVHETKGTGLGLNLVSHIVNAHDGNIEVSSNLGQGTQFTISLPKTDHNG